MDIYLICCYIGNIIKLCNFSATLYLYICLSFVVADCLKALDSAYKYDYDEEEYHLQCNKYNDKVTRKEHALFLYHCIFSGGNIL